MFLEENLILEIKEIYNKMGMLSSILLIVALMESSNAHAISPKKPLKGDIGLIGDIMAAHKNYADNTYAGSLHRNSSRTICKRGPKTCPVAKTCPVPEAETCEEEETCPVPKTCPVAETCSGPTLQVFLIRKTWPEARSHCKSLGGDLATFPNSTQLVRAQEQTRMGFVHSARWIGGHCEGAQGECHRAEKTKQWKWIGGGEISYDLKYWNNYPHAYAEPHLFAEPGCLYMEGG